MAEELPGQEHSFHPLEISEPHIIYVALGFFIVIVGSRWLMRSSSACSHCFSRRDCILAKHLLPWLLVSLLVCAEALIRSGPSAAMIIRPNHWGDQTAEAPGLHTTDEITLEVMRVCIALSVFAVGVEVRCISYGSYPRSTYGDIGSLLLCCWDLSCCGVGWSLVY